MRLAYQGSGERDPLGFAARERLGPIVLVPEQIDLFERGAATRPASRPSRPRTTLASTRAHGNNRGSWYTTERRAGTHSSPTAPGSSPANARRIVLLPEPLRPSSATNWRRAESEVDATENLTFAEIATEATDDHGGVGGEAGGGKTHGRGGERGRHRPDCQRKRAASRPRTNTSVSNPKMA